MKTVMGRVARAARAVADWVFARLCAARVKCGFPARSFIELLERRVFLDALPSWVTPASAATWSTAANTLTATGPTTIIADPGTTGTASEPIITASGSSAVITVAPAAAPAPTIVHIGGLGLTDGASLIMAPPAGGATQQTHNVLVVGIRTGSAVPTFSIDTADGSTLDLGANDLVVRKGDLAAIQQYILDGRNIGGSTGGLWGGTGITSSAAAADDAGAEKGSSLIL
jgi:hypothetical protein